MAASRTLSPEPTQEVFSWLKNLPLAPEYHPTVAEFQDPIAYIFKIEKEASMYGICKIVPPVPPAPKKSIISNFNRSLAARARENPAQSSPTFTTRQQQIGFCPRKPCPVKKPVWQSGESYTLQDFEAKARAFERNYLKKCSKKGNPSALEIETLYWKATVDKPFSVEYANDMPGSAFAPLSSRKGRRDAGEGQGNVGDSNWNMRGVSRSNGSLLRFMKEEIPGVTSPMVYVAMLFSWFAWHVEDHDLHSLNYLHMGAGKTWYGVPRDAAVAFEEVVRVQGYGGEVNPLVTFAILGEKTTLISPEVLVGAGVPCCRLVQNAGEFVVTFPRAYHSGFSHGFNCGEAANIATPEWLRVAKEAAIRRASINYPPMVSHFQLLYDLALALCTRVPSGINTVPRSSRLKDKKKGEGESMIKDQFVQDVIQNNDLLHILGKGSSVVLLPQNSADISLCTNLFVGANSRLTLGLCDPDEVMTSPKNFGSENNMSDRKRVLNPLKGPYSMNAKFASLCERKRFSFSGNGDVQTPDSQTPGRFTGDDKTALGDMLSDQRLFSCVTCGILTFSCAAILQPREPAARYLMSAECSFFNDWTVNSGIPSEGFSIADGRALASGQRHFGGLNRRGIADGLYDLPVQAADFDHQSPHLSDQVVSSTGKERGTSALGLIGLNYGNSSDSEDEHIEGNPSDDESAMRASSLENGETGPSSKDRSCQNSDTPPQLETSMRSTNSDSKCGSIPMVKPCDTSYVPKSDEDSSRMHVFCLEHAIEVEKQLRPIGGVDVYLICHPEYPKVEAEAKLVAEELGNNYLWRDVTFRNAYKEDEDRIKAALDSEDAIPSSGDWAVKLGINLFYSVRLSWSSLYSKQMPYNSVIYNAFGRSSSMKYNDECGKRSKRKVVVGKWCGKVWMSNQIHPFLAQKDDEDVERQEEDEEEEERNFNASVIREEKPVRRSVGKSGNNNMVTKKYERKRKTAAPCRASKKSRSICKEDDEEEEVAASDDSLVKRAKSFKREDLVFSSKGKSVEKEYSNSDDNSMEETYRQVQPHKKIYRSGNNKAAQFTPVEDVMNSDVSQSGDSQQEKEVSDDSGGIDSHHHQQQQQQLPKMYSRRKQARNHNYADHNDNVVLNDNLLEGKSLRQPRSLRNKRQKQTGNQIVRTLNCEMSPPVIKPLNQGLKGRISLPVRQRTPRIVSKEVITPRPKSDSKYELGESGERQSSESCEEEEPQRGPSTRRRTRSSAPAKGAGARTQGSKQITSQKKKVSANASPAVKKKVTGSTSGSKMRAEEGEYHCDLEGCAMSFTSKQELILHKKNICPVKGCGKKFFSHKYLVQHRRVHMDDRPLKCPWKGCKMTFKWAWARTEHIRVHTGVRPYVCGEPGCGQTFRFVSDFSRHKRKTGHSVKGKG